MKSKSLSKFPWEVLDIITKPIGKVDEICLALTRKDLYAHLHSSLKTRRQVFYSWFTHPWRMPHEIVCMPYAGLVDIDSHISISFRERNELIEYIEELKYL
jgi:hypothetical protein